MQDVVTAWENRKCSRCHEPFREHQRRMPHYCPLDEGRYNRGSQFTPNGFTCPVCTMTSYNPMDEMNGYCGNCHDFTGGIDHA